MFTYPRTIFLRETDATGVLYFSEQFNLALEALEAFFLSKGFSVHELIENADFLLPIVHAESDYKAPLRVGDRIEVKLMLDSVGTSSYSLEARFIDEKGAEVGTTKVVQVAVSKSSGESIPLPELLLTHLRELSN